ncbi:hypothetical protein SAY87_019960 [Trapa incisa]|uniref:non-specific serine/threonine protein kinase n=1 Tax=Trapa incisa TaxID=236973 RepID=A0AAN7Q3S5_9MYRT|nr:hypothetical protein SAY87_019960 [Trapa incisa]
MDRQKETSSSPIGVLEDFLRSSDSDSNSAASDLQARPGPRPASRWRSLVQSLWTKSKKEAPHPFGDTMRAPPIKRSNSMRELISIAPCFLLKSGSNTSNPMWKHFTLSELHSATNNFNAENLIGKGGYAEVYRGSLRDGQLVAIKRLIKGTPDEIIGDFLSELGIMAHVKHRNTAKLIGYGVEGGMHLVLELSPHGSLASVLYGLKVKLDWKTRHKIALGTAEGLLYLHEGCQRRIIHRDIKAANVLLTEDFEPQICDFGLAKWLPENWTHHVVSKFEGTFGYLAPEYLMHGIVDEKTDVFSFGVLLLELVTGRRALDYSQQSLVLWAKPLLRKYHVEELVDPSLGNDYDARQLNLVLLAASLCVQQSSIRRPAMSQVVKVLNGDIGSFMRKIRTPFFRKAFVEQGYNSIQD